jgi:hypothetical protein
MSDTFLKKPKRKLSTFELSASTRAAINRVALLRGWTKTNVVETAVSLLNQQTKNTK